MTFCPHYFKIVSGVGKSQYPLVAFDNALRNAGIGDYNILKVSSILPVNCAYSDDIPLNSGCVLYAAYSTITVREDENGAAAVAVAIPSSSNDSGVIFEHSLINTKGGLKEIVQAMCCEAMQNRNKTVSNIMSISQEVNGEHGFYVSAISAVVMW